MSVERPEAVDLDEELWDTLRQIGPATFAEVHQDLASRVRFGFVMVSGEMRTHEAAWKRLLAAGRIARVATGASYRVVYPIAPPAEAIEPAAKCETGRLF